MITPRKTNEPIGDWSTKSLQTMKRSTQKKLPTVFTSEQIRDELRKRGVQ